MRPQMCIDAIFIINGDSHQLQTTSENVTRAKRCKMSRQHHLLSELWHLLFFHAQMTQARETIDCQE